MGKRYIGIDLHRNRFTCCIRLVFRLSLKWKPSVSR